MGERALKGVMAKYFFMWKHQQEKNDIGGLDADLWREGYLRGLYEGVRDTLEATGHYDEKDDPQTEQYSGQSKVTVADNGAVTFE